MICQTKGYLTLSIMPGEQKRNQANPSVLWQLG